MTMKTVFGDKIPLTVSFTVVCRQLSQNYDPFPPLIWPLTFTPASWPSGRRWPRQPAHVRTTPETEADSGQVQEQPRLLQGVESAPWGWGAMTLLAANKEGGYVVCGWSPWHQRISAAPCRRSDAVCSVVQCGLYNLDFHRPLIL